MRPYKQSHLRIYKIPWDIYSWHVSTLNFRLLLKLEGARESAYLRQVNHPYRIAILSGGVQTVPGNMRVIFEVRSSFNRFQLVLLTGPLRAHTQGSFFSKNFSVASVNFAVNKLKTTRRRKKLTSKGTSLACPLSNSVNRSSINVSAAAQPPETDGTPLANSHNRHARAGLIRHKRKQWTYVFLQSRRILALTLSRHGCISASRRQLQWVSGSDADSSFFWHTFVKRNWSQWDVSHWTQWQHGLFGYRSLVRRVSGLKVRCSEKSLVRMVTP